MGGYGGVCGGVVVRASTLPPRDVGRLRELSQNRLGFVFAYRRATTRAAPCSPQAWNSSHGGFRFHSPRCGGGLCLPDHVRGVHFNRANRRPQNIRNGLKLTPRAGSGTRRATLRRGGWDRPPHRLAPPSLTGPPYGGRAHSLRQRLVKVVACSSFQTAALKQRIGYLLLVPPATSPTAAAPARCCRRRLEKSTTFHQPLPSGNWRDLHRWVAPGPAPPVGEVGGSVPLGRGGRALPTAPDSGRQLRPLTLGFSAGGRVWAEWTPEARHGRQSPAAATEGNETETSAGL